MRRRSILKAGVGLIGATIGAVIGIPSLIASLTPVAAGKKGQSFWRPLGSLSSFPVGKTLLVKVELGPDATAESLRHKGVYLRRESENEIIVFSRSCTDLGCPVNHDPGSDWFFCPCHGGIFDEQGERRAGPPKRALYRYANRIRNGVVEIDLLSLPPMT